MLGINVENIGYFERMKTSKERKVSPVNIEDFHFHFSLKRKTNDGDDDYSAKVRETRGRRVVGECSTINQKVNFSFMIFTSREI